MRRLLTASSLLLPMALAGCLQEFSLDEPDEPNVPSPEPPSLDWGSWLSMDTSPNGQELVIAYYDREFGALGFAVGYPDEDGSVSWLHEKVDGYQDANSGLDTGDRGLYASMKVGPDGTVWIASYDATLRQLRWAHRNSGGPATYSKYSWTTGVIDADPGVGTWCSLDLDANGVPVVAYHDETNGTLKVARLDPATIADGSYVWTNTVAYQGQPYVAVDTDDESRPADVGEHARLEIEGGTEFIAFYDKAQQQLGFVEGQSGVYSGGLISTPGLHQGQWPSILLDGGTVFVAHHDVGAQSLIVSTRQQGGWLHETADNSKFVGADTEIFKRAGKLSVLYFDGHDNDQKLATKEGSVWVTDTVAGDGLPIGFHNEIARIGDDWWIASFDFSSRGVVTEKLPTGAVAN